MKKTNQTLEPPRISWETAHYEDNPFNVGDVSDADLPVVSADFLPKPEDLVFKQSTQKVTLRLDTESIRFFKREAQRLDTSYQGMIRSLIRQYVSHAKK